MFTTFRGTSPRAGEHHHAHDATPRSKRVQVHRACDWCKLMRIKCESQRPCHNCKQAGRDCASNGENRFRSIAAAAKEVERLRAQVRDFESRMKHAQRSPPHAAPPPPAHHVEVRRASLCDTIPDRPAASRDGVRVRSVLYGMSSLPFFLNRMSSFLETALHQPRLDIATCAGDPDPAVLALQPRVCADFLGRAQEQHLLDLFWQTHFFSYPIIHEADFRRECQALWADCAPDAPRPPSPLVDIVLALCMQLGASLVHPASPPGDYASPEPHVSTLAGFQYYQRCQTLIGETLEAPSMVTVQCCIFSIVYLREAGLLNRAQVAAGKAIMTAMLLGLHNEPRPDESEAQKELARRTWWSLYILDSQLSIEVGRPSLIAPSHSTCRLPSDTLEIAQSLGPHYMFDETCISWLGFQSQTLRLLDMVRTISTDFFAKYDAVVGGASVADFYSNGAAREECARFLTEQMKKLTGWARQMPECYRMPRRGGESFSTDRSPLDLSIDVPIHCLRQRLLLELQYHQYSMSLYQPFICFTPTPAISMPLSDSKATASLNHAIALTNMIHQALTCSELLSGMNQVFRWQKGALFTMLGFAYTYPVSHSTVATRRAIETAIAVADMYRDALPEAAQVAAIARSLADRVGAIISGFGTRSCPAPADAANEAGRPAAKWRTQPSANGSPDESSTSPTGGARVPQNSADLAVATPGEALDLQFLQKLGAGSDWGDMDALWASLEPGPGSNGSGDAWMALGDAAMVGLSESEVEVTP